MLKLDKKNLLSCAEVMQLIDENYKYNWAYGEWEDEPDFFDFQYKGYDCFGSRNEITGVWQGYIFLPADSKYKNEVERDKLEFYTRLTYMEDENQNYKLSFSCDRPGQDIAPAAVRIKRIVEVLVRDSKIAEILDEIVFGSPDGENLSVRRLTGLTNSSASYKNVAFVVKELKALVDQLV